MKNFIKYYLLFLLLPLQGMAQQLSVTNLQCQYQRNPMGIEALKPNLSWELQSAGRGVMQTAYRILVADDAAKLIAGTGNVWDSKKVASSASIQVAFAGRSLFSARTYYWKVMVWDNQGHASAWSKTATWQMGLLNKSGWNGAQWIAYNRIPDSAVIIPHIHQRGPKKLGLANDTLPLLRKEITIKAGLKKATVYICGLGHFELSLNGKKVGDHFLDPGWTAYDKQALYVPFDLTAMLKPGKNVLGVMLGNGFYYIPRDKRYRKLTGAYGYPKMISRLVLEYADGHTDNIVSDQTWKASPGPIIYSSIYGGEDYDATKEQAGWNKPGFNDANWRKVITVDGSPQLDPQVADPLRIFETFSPTGVKHLPTGQWVFDLGQNFSGIPQITVKGKRGDTVRIYPAELLSADGSANQRGSGPPHYYDYILKGGGEETWQPQFTYYGFRYIQIEGAENQGGTNPENKPVIISVKGLHTRNAAAQSGNFSCSNDLFNRTFKLIDWSVKSNMASVFTDCPHREKLGWLEEAHLVGGSIHYRYDIHRLALKCINDMRVAQTPEGLIPEIAPEFTKFGEPFRDSPEWGSNGIILPWYVYQWYGNKEVLSESYNMMKRYMNYLATKANDHILTQGLGDWYDIGPNHPGLSQNTTKGVTATAIYYYDADIMQKVAALLGKREDIAKWKQLAEEIKSAYNKKFYDNRTNNYGSASQTANAMSLFMGLVDDADKPKVLENLVKDIRNRNNALTAGDIGFRYLLRALEDGGRSDVIFDMNNRDDVPGYGYQLAHGATALTESWNALAGVSNNHLMLGHLQEWFYAGLAGIRQADASIGYRLIEIKPEPVGNITFARADTRTPYGKVSSSWNKGANKFELNTTFPANTGAMIYLPISEKATVMLDGKKISASKFIQRVGYKNGRAIYRVGSGTYNFTAIW